MEDVRRIAKKMELRDSITLVFSSEFDSVIPADASEAILRLDRATG